MAGISSLGIGSGLDLGALVDNLLASERGPVENSINRQQNKLTAELSGTGIFRGAISSFQSSLSGLSNPEQYTTRSLSNSNQSALSTSITNEAAIGSYNIDITNLAENHSLVSAVDSFSSLDEIVGTGTMQVRFGAITGPGFTSFAPNADTTVQTLTIDSTNNTLSGLRDYINEGDYGVTASIINDGSGYRLTMLSENSGTNSAMEVIITDTGDNIDTDSSGLSRLAFNASATQMTETQAAEDATLTVNGIDVTSSKNTLNDMIEGVSLTLKEETSGSSFNVTVSENTSGVSSAITKVVESYNTMMSSLSDLGKAGPEGSEAGILIGDSVLRSFVNSVRSQMTGTVAGLTGSITALSTIGISTQIDGTLTIDSDKFNSAIADNPTDALALFAPVGQLDDNQTVFDGFTDNSVAGSYAINVTQIATQSSLAGNTGLGLPITIDNDNDFLSFKIDGYSSGPISLTQGSYTTGTDLAVEMQLQINSVSTLKAEGISVSVNYNTSTNGFEFTSNTYGSESLIEIVSIDTNTLAELGLSAQLASAGVDVAGTIGNQAATGKGQLLTSTSGDSIGLSLTVSGGSIGSRGNLQFTRGLVESLDYLLAGYLDNDGILSAKEDGLNDSLEGLQLDRENLERRLESLELRLISQFSALDGLIANFQSTGNFIAQQIDSLPGFDNLRK